MTLTLTPTANRRASTRTVATGLRRAVMALGVLIVLGVTIGVGGGAASAQSVGGEPGTSVPTLVQSDPSPFSVGGLMFFFVSAIIIGGAVVLYLRNRQRT